MAENDPQPVAFSEGTYRRHEDAVRYVESEVRTRPPRMGRGRSPGLAPGAWGRLESGATIPGASGVTLGEGTVTLCDRDGVSLPGEQDVAVYNAGVAIEAAGGTLIVALEWTAGVWSACGCGPPPEEEDAACCACFLDPTTGLPYAVSSAGLGGEDIVLTTDGPVGGRTSFTLVGGVGCGWSSECFRYDDDPDNFYPYAQWIYGGVASFGLTLSLIRTSSPDCSGAPFNYECPYTGMPSVNPLSFTTGADHGVYAPDFRPSPLAAVTTITGSQSAPKQRCYWHPQILNCLGEPVVGATVEIRHPGGVVASGVTDATGYTPPLEFTDYELRGDLTWHATGASFAEKTGNFICSGDDLIIVGGTDCCQRFRVLGCLSAGVEGMTVEVRATEGGAVLASGPTDASGEVVLGWDGDCNVWIALSHTSGRWAASEEYWELTSTETTELFPAAADGYHCSGFCNEPLADELQAIDLNGTWPATYDGAHADGAGWYACAVRTGMANVVTNLNAGVCTKVVGTGDVPYVIRLPATGTTIAEYYGQYAAPGQEQTAATPTCSAGVLDLDATIPASCVGGSITRAEATATGNPDSCPESLVITATMPGTGSNSTVNPGSGGITFTE